jgi:hypothetical protein
MCHVLAQRARLYFQQAVVLAANAMLVLHLEKVSDLTERLDEVTLEPSVYRTN